MRHDDMKLTSVTVLNVISVFAHWRALDTLGVLRALACGQLTSSMKATYGVERKVRHYGGVLNLLARDKILDDAVSLMESKPMAPNAPVWGALFGRCRIQLNLDGSSFHYRTGSPLGIVVLLALGFFRYTLTRHSGTMTLHAMAWLVVLQCAPYIRSIVRHLMPLHCESLSLFEHNSGWVRTLFDGAAHGRIYLMITAQIFGRPDLALAACVEGRNLERSHVVAGITAMVGVDCVESVGAYVEYDRVFAIVYPQHVLALVGKIEEQVKASRALSRYLAPSIIVPNDSDLIHEMVWASHHGDSSEAKSKGAFLSGYFVVLSLIFHERLCFGASTVAAGLVILFCFATNFATAIVTRENEVLLSQACCCFCLRDDFLRKV